jgi:DNA-binding MarR family transcriptional regulator
MSIRIPMAGGRPRPDNLALLMREVFVAINDHVLERLAERGHGAVRPVHAAVFQFLDDTGTTVSLLAERAQMTKQAMAELVAHLEAHGYVVRTPDPADRRAKLVRPTERGREVVEIAQALVPEMEQWVDSLLGLDRARALREDLQTLRRAVTAGRGKKVDASTP